MNSSVKTINKTVNKTIILDRDGVINLDSDEFIKSVDEWQPIKGSIEAIAKLSQAGYSVYVLTNQSGIARSLFSIETLGHIHAKMRHLVAEANGHIDGIYFCPHGPDDNCDCRKPLAGLYDQLANDSAITFDGVSSIGDSIRDLEAAVTAGASPVLVLTGKGKRSQEIINSDPNHPLKNIPIYDDLADYVILNI